MITDMEKELRDRIDDVEAMYVGRMRAMQYATTPTERAAYAEQARYWSGVRAGLEFALCDGMTALRRAEVVPSVTQDRNEH